MTSEKRLSFQEFKDLVATASLWPGFHFDLSEDELPQGFVYVTASWRVPDVRPPHQPTKASRVWRVHVGNLPSEAGLKSQLRSLAAGLALHEVDEWLRVGGERVALTHTTGV